MPHVTIYRGDNLRAMALMRPSSVHTVVTSVPYYGIRDYGIDGQIGLEPSLHAWVQSLVEVFRAVRRVLRPDGTVWLNVGDAYEGGTSIPRNPGNGSVGSWARASNSVRHSTGELEDKQLMLQPARLSLALQADGWIVRCDPVFEKINPTPGSATDRPMRSHEYVFLLTQQKRYYYDRFAVMVPASENSHPRGKGVVHSAAPQGFGVMNNTSWNASVTKVPTLRNLRSVWSMTVDQFPGEHHAIFPPEIPAIATLAGTSEKGCCAKCGAPWVRMLEKKHYGNWRDYEGSAENRRSIGLNQNKMIKDASKYEPPKTVGWQPSCTCGVLQPVPCTVFDPFGGTGTTAGAAAFYGRDSVLCELNPKYIEVVPARMASVFKRLTQWEERKRR